MNTPRQRPTFYRYLNQEKIDSLFSQINGSLIAEWKETKQKGGNVKGKIGIEVGNLLAQLGIGKVLGEGQAERTYDNTFETLNHLTVGNRVIFVREYWTLANLLF